MPKAARLLLVLIVVLLLVVMHSSLVYAHRLVLEYDGRVFTVRYDDGTAAARAVVSLLDEGGRVLWEGAVDNQGKVEPPVKVFARARADDGLGHRANYVPGSSGREVPKPLAAALGVSFFLFVASLGNYAAKKKSQ